MSWIEPLALQTWFVNVLSGTPEIFIILAMIIISSAAARFNMPNSITLAMIVIFIVMVNFYIEVGGIFLLVIFLVGIFTFFSVKRIWD